MMLRDHPENIKMIFSEQKTQKRTETIYPKKTCIPRFVNEDENIFCLIAGLFTVLKLLRILLRLFIPLLLP
jgi:hypothetical protein